MDQIHDIELQDCPRCRDGIGIMEEESGWCVYVVCTDCGMRTAEIPFENEQERLEAAKKAAAAWNAGKVIFTGASD